MLQQSSIKKLQNICKVAENRMETHDAELIKTLVAEIIRAEENAGKAKTEKFNLYDYTEKKKNCRPVLECVYHDGGYKVATNGCVLIALKDDYDPTFEGKTFKKNGEEFAGTVYPKWRSVIPKHDTEDWVRVNFKPLEFKNWLEEKRAAYKAENAKSVKFDDFWQVRILGSHITAERYSQLLAAAKRFGTNELIINKNDKGRAWIVENENGVAIAMPFWDEEYYTYLDL